MGNSYCLSDSPKLSTQAHFPPQRVKQLLHVAVITANEKGQAPKHSSTDKLRGKGAPAVKFPPPLSLSLSLFSISLHYPSTSSPSPLSTAPTRHGTARLCHGKQRTLHRCLCAAQGLTQGSSAFPSLHRHDERQARRMNGAKRKTKEKEMLAW